MRELVKNIKQTSIGATKKFFFVLSNLLCGLTSLTVFAFSIYEFQRVSNYFKFTLVYPILLAICCGLLMFSNFLACLGVILRSIKILRFQYLVMWMIFVTLFVFLHIAIVPTIEECGDVYFKREFVYTQKRLMIGGLVVQIVQVGNLI